MIALDRAACARAPAGRRSPSIRTGTPWSRSSLGLPGDVLLEQAHQRLDLAGRPLPVLLAEGEQGEHLDARLDAALDHLAHGLHAGVVAERARQRAALGPAAVAVHDDRDVGRDGSVQPQR